LFEKDLAKLGVELFELLWSWPIHQNSGGNYFLRVCDRGIDARIESELTLLGDEFLTFNRPRSLPSSSGTRTPND
jgi:hypothetical protein